jgi:hypothetical protein
VSVISLYNKYHLLHESFFIIFEIVCFKQVYWISAVLAGIFGAFTFDYVQGGRGKTRTSSTAEQGTGTLGLIHGQKRAAACGRDLGHNEDHQGQIASPGHRHSRQLDVAVASNGVEMTLTSPVDEYSMRQA